jgi:rhomboid family GlyGly-CTERM serine protease
MAAQQPVGRFKFSLSSLNSDGGRGVALLAICALLVTLELAGGEPGRVALRYDRAALQSGEWWRLLTGHFVHLNLEHALLNAAGLALMWALFARDYTLRQWALIVLACIAAVDMGLWFRDSRLAWYVGASGVLHGVMTAGALAHLRRGKFDGWILATFLIVKLTYESLAGAMPFSSDIGPVVVNAHLYGAVGGLTAAIIFRAAARGTYETCVKP